MFSRVPVKGTSFMRHSFLFTKHAVLHSTYYEYQQHNIRIAFCNLLGDQTAQNQAHILVAVMDGYIITHKLHCYVGSNASNNNTKLIAALNAECGVNLTSNRRIRCTGHKINLIVKAIIYGKGVGKFELRLAATASRRQFEIF